MGKVKGFWCECCGDYLTYTVGNVGQKRWQKVLCACGHRTPVFDFEVSNTHTWMKSQMADMFDVEA